MRPVAPHIQPGALACADDAAIGPNDEGCCRHPRPASVRPPVAESSCNAPPRPNTKLPALKTEPNTPTVLGRAGMTNRSPSSRQGRAKRCRWGHLQNDAAGRANGAHPLHQLVGVDLTRSGWWLPSGRRTLRGGVRPVHSPGHAWCARIQLLLLSHAFPRELSAEHEGPGVRPPAAATGIGERAARGRMYSPGAEPRPPRGRACSGAAAVARW